MPYVSQELRKAPKPQSAGELNFRITQLLNNFLLDWGLTYGSVNTCVGALECAKLELYRRVAVPYEIEKMMVHGDVYDRSLVK